jgi:threonine dehydrogenase-like Zn-dependent dehydrogenase
MKALVLREYKRLSFEDVAVPSPAPDEVLVAVQACGICGSDVHGFDGSTGRRRPPIIMGHEAAGVIAEVGKQVTGWSAGDRVTFDSTIYCGQCDFCKEGKINLCDRRRVLGVSCEDYRRDGAFAEYVAVPQRVLYRLPQGLAFEHAALVEPFAIALHAIQRTPPALNDTAVVLGAGMIGLALTQALRRTGCGQLIVVDTADDRLARASYFGATKTLNPSTGNAAEKILEWTQGRGVDLAFEAVGVTATVDLALRCMRKGGAATLVGNVAPKIEFPLQTAVTRELSVYGSCASRGEYPACLAMLDRGELHAAPLISATPPLSEGAAWFNRLYSKENGLLKVILRPGVAAR